MACSAKSWTLQLKIRAALTGASVQDLAEQAINDFLADGRAIVRQLFAEA